MAERIIDKTENVQNSGGKKKKHKKKNYLLRFIVFLVVVTGLVVFLMSDFFNVTAIEVNGNRYYTAAQVTELSGLKTGYNLYKTDVSSAKENLLQDPYIKNVSIKKIPRGTILIDIEERVERAAIPYGSQYVLIDYDGFVLRIADKLPVLPVLDGMTLLEMTPGLPLSVEENYLLSDTLELLNAVDENDLYFKKINFSAVIVRAYIYDEFYCEGTPGNMTANMANIKLLAERLYSEGIDRGVIKVGKDNYLTYSPKID